MSNPVIVVALLAVVGLAGWLWELSRTPRPLHINGSAVALQALLALGAAYGLFKLTNLPLVAASPVVLFLASTSAALTAGCQLATRPSLIALGALPSVMAVWAQTVDKDWLWIGAALTVVASLGFWSGWSKTHRNDLAALPVSTASTSLLLLFLKLQHVDTGLEIVGALVLVATLGVALSALGENKLSWTPVGSGVLIAAASALAVHFGFHQTPLAIVVGTAGVTALVIGWLWGEADPTPTAGALAVLAWTGVTTVAFSQAQTPGLAAAALVGLGVSCATKRPGAIAAMAPLLALAAYRLLRNLAPDTLDAMDIGQHYVVVGLLVGASVTVALNEFVSGMAETGGWKPTVGFTAGWLAAGGLAAFASLFLGDKGTVGVVFGLALGGALSCLSGRGALPGAVFGAGLSWFTAAFAPVMADWVRLNKENKMGVLGVAVLVALVLVATAAALTRPTSEEPRAEA